MHDIPPDGIVDTVTFFGPWHLNDEWARSLARKIAACERLLLAGERLRAEKYEGSILPAFEEHTRASKSLRALLLLASAGYGQQGQMVALSVFESSVITLWAIEHQADAEGLVERHASRVRREYDRGHTDADRSRAVHSQRSPRDRNEQPVPKDNGQDVERYWTGHARLADLIDDVVRESSPADFSDELDRVYRLGARWAGYLAAPTGIANQSFRCQTEFEIDDEVVAVQSGPDEREVFDALRTASLGYSWATSALANAVGADIDAQLRDANGLLWRAWRTPEELGRVTDVDPCLCGKANVTWGDCHGWTASLGSKADVVAAPEQMTAAGKISPASEPLASSKPVPLSNLDDQVVFTFACRLPFALGLDDSVPITLPLNTRYLDPNDTAHFGPQPYVRVRICNAPFKGHQMFPATTAEAIARLYGQSEAGSWVDLPHWGEGHAYEQWVSLETPSGRLQLEQNDGPPYAFHRCLVALNVLLHAHYLAFREIEIFPIAPNDLRPIVLRGYYDQRGSWNSLGELIMFPESLPSYRTPKYDAATSEKLGRTIERLGYGEPYLTTVLWEGRAKRAFRFRGDHSDCVISFQTAVESMLVATWRMMLIDLGYTSDTITTEVERDFSFKHMVVTVMPLLLGGSWDITKKGSAVAAYWADIYEVRNRVVHVGHEARVEEAERAQAAYRQIRDYVSERLWINYRKYPRTIMLKCGNDLDSRGAPGRWMQDFARHVEAEPRPWFWPKDIAGR